MKETDKILSDEALDTLFREARTYNKWQDRDVSDVVLQALFDLLKMGPTAANCCPARFVFVKSAGEKEKLRPLLSEGNVDKTMSAPVTALIAYDLQFHEQLPKLFPHTDARSWYAGKDAFIQESAFRNGSLQGAYMIMAARSLGLDCGPMSGFNAKGVKEVFFADQDVTVNFICNLGYGDSEGLHPRLPRFDFDEVCQII